MSVFFPYDLAVRMCNGAATRIVTERYAATLLRELRVSSTYYNCVCFTGGKNKNYIIIAELKAMHCVIR